MHACETVLHWERVRGVRMHACKTVVLHHDSVRDKDVRCSSCANGGSGVYSFQCTAAC